MKNWKYIHVGNYDAQEKLGLKPVPKTIPVNEHDKKTILEIYEKAGRNYDRAKRMIKEKFIGFDDNAAKTALESVIGSNGKGLNESIYKQEASLFGGLGEKAEKEIGNAISDYSVVTTKDGYFVYKKGQKVGGPFQNEEQAKTFAAQLQTKDPQWTNKTGNADTVSEYNAEIQRLTKKAEELRRMGQGRSAMEIEKQIEKLGKELRELGNSKTGNSYLSSDAQKDISLYRRQMDQIDREITRLKSKRDNEKDERIQAQIDDKIDDLAEKLSYLESDIAEARKAMKTGNRNFAIIQKTAWGSTKIAEWEANSPEEAVREFEQANPAYANGKKGRIVANAKPGSIASIGPAWMHGGTVYGKMDTDESGKRHNEYVKITWLGEGKGGVANYFIDDRMQSEKFGSLDKNELKRWAEAKIGNKKVGNYFNNGVHLTIRYNGKEEEVKVLKDMPTKVLVKGQSGNVVEINKTDLDVIKVHNETKGERKFGKVMGEFEEGALKTPQGKTVTDPAQAKAIAYSEADKVDNLKRARNAMNKKVTNSSVREYKDSEGRIAQIDFNSDGTDADLSIYEDERMTKSVESKNFSTIRDAEQYVQSHGFRRVG